MKIILHQFWVKVLNKWNDFAESNSAILKRQTLSIWHRSLEHISIYSNLNFWYSHTSSEFTLINTNIFCILFKSALFSSIKIKKWGKEKRYTKIKKVIIEWIEYPAWNCVLYEHCSLDFYDFMWHEHCSFLMVWNDHFF